MAKRSDRRRKLAPRQEVSSDAVVDPDPQPEPEPEVEVLDEKGLTPAQKEHRRKMRDDPEYRKEHYAQRKKRKEERRAEWLPKYKAKLRH
jgi:hypothetical protein